MFVIDRISSSFLAHYELTTPRFELFHVGADSQIHASIFHFNGFMFIFLSFP